MIGRVVAALAGHLAAGGLLLTAVLSLKNDLPVAFIRFCTAASAGLALVASLSSPASIDRWLWAWLGAAALAAYFVARKATPELQLKKITLLSALASVLAPALVAWLAGGAVPRLSVASALSSALLLGAVAVTMILGHWYLVDTGLSIAPLRDGARWVSLAVVVRVSVVSAALLLGGWETLSVARAADLIFSTNGLFFLFRALMGLGAPLVVAGLVWQTVKIRSTQSATGLLYVALILVLFGELVSSFLRLRTGYPL